MRIIILVWIQMTLLFTAVAQNLEVHGTAKITQMVGVDDADSVVVSLPDGTLGILDKNTLSKNLENPNEPQDAATKAYVDDLIVQIMNELANANEVFTSPTTGIVTDQQGNNYNIIRIGSSANNSNSTNKVNNNARNSNVGTSNQWWMTENLKVTNYNDGTPISLISDGIAWAGLTTPAYCWYDNNQVSYGDTYGALYNYFVGADTNTRNVCPLGWHVPTDGDWSILVTNLDPQADPDATGLSHSMVAGGKMKETGFVHWDAPNEGATNESGFTVFAQWVPFG